MSVQAFLHGTGTDATGRTLNHILQQDDAWLEQDHTYIQWLFPLQEESLQVHDAPVLSPAMLGEIRADATALANQIRAVERMLHFYQRTDHWLTAMDHNHLRITRMLKSVRLLQSLPAAEAIYNQLLEQAHAAGNPIQPRNITYWTDAVGLSYGL